MRAYTDRENVNSLRKAINDDQPFVFISYIDDEEIIRFAKHQLGIEMDDIEFEYLFDKLGTLIGDCLAKAVEEKFTNDSVERVNIKTPNMEESESIPVKGQFSDLPEEFKQMIIDKILNEVSDMRGTDND